MKYAFDKTTGKYIGVYSDDFDLPSTMDSTINAPLINTLRPQINTTKDGWIEGASEYDILQVQIKKQQADKEKIIKEKLEKMVEEQVNLNPVANKLFYPIWVSSSYALGVKVQFKDKLFINELSNNTNAPDKGGWKELK